MIGYFVTGTDTNVGKTYVTCALARRARAIGHRVFAFKPVETGCAPGPDGNLLGADQELLVAAAGGWQTGPLKGLYRLPLPAAPLVAATAAGASIDLALISQTIRHGAAEPGVSVTLVEGAGGWRVPLTASADMAALARELGLPVLVVARAGLGTINHTLLTIEAVQCDGASLAAVIFSQRADDDPAFTLSNRAEIRRRWPGQLLILGSLESSLDPLLRAGEPASAPR